ncbi:L,D-transpeptidase family protein [Streptomyces sp. MST-110588]|uniref:L,D-transpeptidase family protein n=1 Tax=Streptomyces sp. MST-110588 TaxID=2833628 RepID=UPI001F5DA918|nr:L,D-transpeptidase family protein [Streptomyces sp. MST-110588]UNO43270.1 L,D-transpeptidase family protein [Streptomyces sp. MST-110588]
MRGAGAVRRAAAVAAVTAGLVLLAGCGGGGSGAGKEDGTAKNGDQKPGAATRHLPRVPDVGERLLSRIPARSHQVVAVYGKGVNSPDATVVLYTKDDKGWNRQATWPGHNGRNGWTTDHHEGDKRSPVGVFTLSDAGGVLPAPSPGTKLPYAHSSAFTPPPYWAKNTHHDFDHVIAIDYNRVRGTTPLDPTRPAGQAKGGGIWLHMDHGSGTSGCVSVSRQAMEHLLRTLDPRQHPVVVMGDMAHLTAG